MLPEENEGAGSVKLSPMGQVFAKAGYETVYGAKTTCSHDNQGGGLQEHRKRFRG